MMERRYLSVLFCVSLALVSLALCLLLLSSGADLSEPEMALAQGSPTRYVAPGGDCGGAFPCYAAVQSAVDAADPGDVIKVAAGNYTDIHVRNSLTQVVYISKTVTIRGGYTTTNGFADPPDLDANPTTLDAQGDGRVLVIIGAGPTVERLIITGGGGYYSGGGIYVKSASPVICRNRIMGNSADGDGGAIFVNWGSAQILHNQIADNRATWAGGLRIISDADATIVGNEILGNVAQNSGGGIELDCCGGSTPFVTQNIIVGNNGGAHGGGILVFGTNALLVNNVLATNQAKNGAGIWLDGRASFPVSTTLMHNTLAGGLAEGEGVSVGTYVTAKLVNNIIVSHTTGITNTAPASSTVAADYTLFDGNDTPYGSGVSSAHEVGGNPVFVDPAEGNYHIGLGSAAIDRATDAGVMTDLDGDPRPIGSLPDLGADEVRWWVFLPLVLRGS